MNKKIYIANWKMNLNVKEANNYFDDFFSIYKDSPDKEVVFCPSFTTLFSVSNKFSKFKKISFGAQNVSHFKEGAQTGEISVNMLNELLCKYCIVGHSERRNNYQETDDLINKKIKKLMAKNIVPILCVGESYEARKNNMSEDVIKSQLSESLDSINMHDKNKIIFIAYEPIWAIGSGKSATKEDISSMNSVIRSYMITLGFNIEQFYILYGGSVDINNVLILKKATYLNGFLIGGASLNAHNFCSIIKK